MATTHFTGPVQSDNGFIGTVTGNVTGNVTGAITATTISASGNVSLTGTGNAIVLPTADPHVAGAVWNNSGVFAISAG